MDKGPTDNAIDRKIKPRTAKSKLNKKNLIINRGKSCSVTSPQPAELRIFY